MKIILSVFAALIPCCGPATASDVDAWLPLKRSELVDVLAIGKAPDTLKVETLDEFMTRARAKGTLNESEIAAAEAAKGALSAKLPDDDIWLVDVDESRVQVKTFTRSE
jgi:hypothetical protein